MQALQELDWVGLLQEEGARDGQARYVLMADLDHTVLEPLMQRLLLAPEPFTANLWKLGRWRTTTVREALQKE